MINTWNTSNSSSSTRLMSNMKIGRIQGRKLLQQELSNDDMDPTFSPEPFLKNTTTSVSKTPFKINSPFDSSMAITVLILLSFLFLMGFFSVYIRRFSDHETEVRRGRNPSPASRLVVKKKGVDSSTISALPVISFPGSAKQGIIEECTICLGEFQEGEMVKLIPNCRHVFHPSCIDTWLDSHVSCPLCRCSQLFKNVDEVWLDIDREGEKNGGDELGERSTVRGDDTSVEEVGSSEIRRSCSGSNLGGSRMLYRSTSF